MVGDQEDPRRAVVARASPRPGAPVAGTASQEPGWYADPYGRLPFRWWDGSEWTSYAADTAVVWDEVAGADSRAATGNEPPPPPGLRGLGIAVAGYVVGIGLAFAIVAAFSAAHYPGGRAVALLVSELGLWSGLVGACVVVSRRRGTGSLVRDFGWRMRRIDIGLGLAGSLAGRFVSGIVVSPVPAPFRHVRAPDRTVVERLAHGPGSWFIVVVVVCVGAPLVEELFFRGLMQSRLVEIAGPAWGIVITSVLFGAAHLTAWQGSLTFVYALAIVGAGFVLGLIRHLSGRLGPSTWAHAFFNAQAVVASALLGR